MVKRVSSRNRRKGHVRPGNVKRRVKAEKEAIARIQTILGRPSAAPAAPSDEAAESG